MRPGSSLFLDNNPHEVHEVAISAQDKQQMRFDVDYLITKVEMDADRTRIVCCEVYLFVDGFADGTLLHVSRENVVADIRNGRQVRTVLGVAGTLHEGEVVCVIGDSSVILFCVQRQTMFRKRKQFVHEREELQRRIAGEKKQVDAGLLDGIDKLVLASVDLLTVTLYVPQ